MMYVYVRGGVSIVMSPLPWDTVGGIQYRWSLSLLLFPLCLVCQMLCSVDTYMHG